MEKLNLFLYNTKTYTYEKILLKKYIRPIDRTLISIKYVKNFITCNAIIKKRSGIFKKLSTQLEIAQKGINVIFALWGFLHLKSELIREAENQKTDKNHRKTVKYGSIFEGEITKQLKK